MSDNTDNSGDKQDKSKDERVDNDLAEFTNLANDENFMQNDQATSGIKELSKETDKTFPNNITTNNNTNNTNTTNNTIDTSMNDTTPLKTDQSLDKQELKQQKKLMRKMRPVLESHESIMENMSQQQQQQQIALMTDTQSLPRHSLVLSGSMYYELKVKLIEGKNLAIRDISGIFQ